MDKPKTRAEARAIGATRYFNGKPCRRGHVADRFVTGSCVVCSRAAAEDWNKRNPQKLALYSARYYKKDPAKRRQISLKYQRRVKGMPDATRPQPEACECCGKPGKMCLDHCHETGVFRGWLCNHCNLSIGKLGDNAASIRKALEYLIRAGDTT